MTWKAGAEFKPEVTKCRARLANYCRGSGLDIGCGPEKIIPEAIGIDQQGGDINCDISRGMDLFRNGFFDYIFSSHCLEDFKNTEAILSDWWSKIKVGGHLILYLPHRDLYPNIGTHPEANKWHQHDFVPEDIIRVMDTFATHEVVEQSVHGEDDEYSFDIVFKKLASKKVTAGKKIRRDRRPRALVIRYGAFGDQLIATPLIKRLSEDGYHITYNCTDRALPVIQNNPYIDEFLVQGVNLVPNAELDTYWKHLSRKYDKTVNLSESVEARFLRVPDRPNYHDPIEKRREECGKTNYYDYALEAGGYNDVVKPRPELYPTPIEDAMGAFFRRRFEDKFLVLWCLQGSSMHKCYPFGQDVALEFLQRHKDAMTITVGDDLCRLIEWDHERNLKKSAVWDIRSTLLITKWVDLVISPETGVLNASGCYRTPKIGFLTHSNKTNLTKYFSNDYSMQAEIECSPCHRMIYTENAKADCPKMDLGEGAWLCACAPAFDPRKVMERIEYAYKQWKVHQKAGPRIILPGAQGVPLIRPESALRHWGGLREGGMVHSEPTTVRL